MNGNQQRVDAFRAKIEEQSPKKGKRERSYLRSLVMIFVIVAIAATVVDLRKPSADKAQAAFRSSPGHRSNILGKGWTKVGIGIVQDAQGFIYATQIFARD